MADPKHSPNPFDEPFCSFAIAVLWVAWRDIPKVRAAPSLFDPNAWSDGWPDEIMRGLSLLLRLLARDMKAIAAFYSLGTRRIEDESFWPQVWSALKAEEARIGVKREIRRIGPPEVLALLGDGKARFLVGHFVTSSRRSRASRAS